MPRIKYATRGVGAAKRQMIDRANEIIESYRAKGFSLTLRQLYYQFVARDWLPNKQSEYKRLGDAVSDGRELGLIDWSAITDRLRRVRAQAHWSSPKDIVAACASQFRYDLWADQPYRVECWIEKEALAEVLERACHSSGLDTPFLVCRGYVSQTAAWEAGCERYRSWIANGQQPIVIHLGDHDPSGIDMTRDNRERLSRYAGSPVEVRRVALNMDQVEEWQPPPNPTKLSDARAAGYIDRYGRSSWELDALPPDVLVALVRDTIREYIDEDRWAAAVKRQDAARRALRAVEQQWSTVVEHVQQSTEGALGMPSSRTYTTVLLYRCGYCGLEFLTEEERDGHEVKEHE